MRTEQELKQEALNDIIYDAEQKFKAEIKQGIQAIITEQKRMAESAKVIAFWQVKLKEIKLDSINVEI